MIVTQKINKTALYIAAVSFLLGTILCIWFLITRYNLLLGIGLYYVLIASALNSITLIGLITNALINRHTSKETFITILLVLLNIPIALGYFYLVLHINF